ncbi:hypothetical protein TNCV_1531981 [Trichonephila clavipes]|nr:hypothetical protein TNCV_1531981 [Trichonephila clavipes]
MDRTACDEHESLYERRICGYPFHLLPSQRKWKCCCSVVWGKISNEVATESSNFCWSASEHASLRALIDSMPINSKIDLVVRMSIAAATIRETSGILEHARQSMPRPCPSCTHATFTLHSVLWHYCLYVTLSR